MERNEKRRVVEALILAAPEPITAARLAELLPYGKPKLAAELVEELNEEYREQDRAFEIWEVAGGYQMRTRAEFSGYLQQLQKQRPLRLSRAALETLAIIAYRQPVTRGEVEQVRGVDAGPVVRSLLDRDLIRLAGHREVPGRPMLYATSKRFLEVFGLDSLKELPSLRELKELTAVDAEDEAESGDAPATDEAEGGAAAAGDRDAAAADEAVTPDAEALADSPTRGAGEVETTPDPPSEAS